MGNQYAGSKIENRRKESEERGRRLSEARLKQQRSRSARIIVLIAVLVLVLLSSIVFGFAMASRPGRYDAFAQCLSDKGVVMYGADWCEYTGSQKAMFGKSFKYINYKNYEVRPEVKITPAWEIGGQLYERVQSFDRLASLTGCDIS